MLCNPSRLSLLLFPNHPPWSSLSKVALTPHWWSSHQPKQLRHSYHQHKEQFWLQARGRARIKFCFSCLWLQPALLKMEHQKIQITFGVFFRNFLFVFVFKIVLRVDLHCNKEVIFLWQVLQLLRYSSESIALMKVETVRKTDKQTIFSAC